ncbi:MAG: RHS repeat-associated core domain-containing protein, partial [Gammaproteobacteria bacterium]|nr:RHS repeat-associated core domain-containing protein [Gammaproteobacteria bacterium]
MRVRVEPASGTATERFEYVHRDHLGSVDRVTDGTGAAVATLSAASFDPFGGRRDAGWSADESAATAANVLALQDERFSRGFTDHEGLHRTGFVHMNGRVFDPRIGRFLQPDPVVSAPDTAQGHNRYAYVGNAPLSATDPSGLVPVGGYVGRTGGNADYGPLFGSLMNDLWSAGGFETFNLSTFDAVITKGMDPVEFDHYLRTGVDLRRLAQTARGEWLFPEGDDRGNNRDAYGLIITNGILETREDFQNRVTKLGALGYYDPTDGFAGDLLQAIFQKFFPSTDWMARRLAEYLATRED